MTPLELLSRRAGIISEFADAGGETRRPTPAAQRSLLAAVGLRADGDAQAATSLADLDRANWKRELPPVIVVDVNRQPITLELTLPASIDSVAWRVTLEDGGEVAGRLPFHEMTLLERKTAGEHPLERRLMVLDTALPIGYHRLETVHSAAMLIVSPRQCWLPKALREGKRIWGVTAQLYWLRSKRNWGIGDYGDLQHLLRSVGDMGADVVGLNPLHATFPDNPEHASPYSPASRLLLNDLNIDVGNLPELAQSEEAQQIIKSEEFQQQLLDCRSETMVAYTAVARLKRRVLRLLFNAFQTKQDGDRQRAFESFQRNAGKYFGRSCLFLALREYLSSIGHERLDWHSWPEPYQNPSSAAVCRFAEGNKDLVTYQAWLQWVAECQLAEAASLASGMVLGVFRDLAVGADPSGAETWVNRDAFISGARVGAPPDAFSPTGQDWGLPPFNPMRLREEGYRSFIELLQTNMRHAGGLRIDHVMALQQIYCVPAGRAPSDGAYLRYPLDDLIGVLALESHRNKCLVVGEDLGTVPEGFRERLAAANILSYRVLMFEKDDQGFVPPSSYPELSLAVAGNHDLPTLHSWWEARDVGLKERLNLIPSAEATRLRAERDEDRKQLVAALQREDLLPDGAPPDIETLIRAVHSYLSRSRSMIALVQLDDLTGEVDPVNLPSTSDEYPNWRRRLSLSLDEISAHPRLEALAQAFQAGRAARR